MPEARFLKQDLSKLVTLLKRAKMIQINSRERFRIEAVRKGYDEDCLTALLFYQII